MSCSRLIALVFLLIVAGGLGTAGVVFIRRYFHETMRHDEAQAFALPSLCRVEGFRNSTVSDGGGCLIQLFNLTRFYVEMPSDTYRLPRVRYQYGCYSFSNFFPDACGGLILGPSAIGTNITCFAQGLFLAEVQEKRLRVSPVPQVDGSNLTFAIVCFVSIAALPFGLCCSTVIRRMIDRLTQQEQRVRLHERQQRRVAVPPVWHEPGDGEMMNNMVDPVVVWVSSHVVEVGSENWRDELTSHRALEQLQPTGMPVGGDSSVADTFIAHSLEALEGDWTAIDCPVCYSTLADKAEAAWWPCGHVVCAECAVNVFNTDLSEDRNACQGYRCPQCRVRAAIPRIKRLCRHSPPLTTSTA